MKLEEFDKLVSSTSVKNVSIYCYGERHDYIPHHIPEKFRDMEVTGAIPTPHDDKGLTLFLDDGYER